MCLQHISQGFHARRPACCSRTPSTHTSDTEETMHLTLPHGPGIRWAGMGANGWWSMHGRPAPGRGSARPAARGCRPPLTCPPPRVYRSPPFHAYNACGRVILRKPQTEKGGENPAQPSSWSNASFVVKSMQTGAFQGILHVVMLLICRLFLYLASNILHASVRQGACSGDWLYAVEYSKTRELPKAGSKAGQVHARVPLVV